MTTPRIGNTVHYRDGGHQYDGNPPLPEHCLASIVIDNDFDGAAINLTVWKRDGDTFTAYPSYDTNGATIDNDGNTSPAFGGFTPGTWHHIH